MSALCPQSRIDVYVMPCIICAEYTTPLTSYIPANNKEMISSIQYVIGLWDHNHHPIWLGVAPDLLILTLSFEVSAGSCM